MTIEKNGVVVIKVRQSEATTTNKNKWLQEIAEQRGIPVGNIKVRWDFVELGVKPDSNETRRKANNVTKSLSDPIVLKEKYKQILEENQFKDFTRFFKIDEEVSKQLKGEVYTQAISRRPTVLWIRGNNIFSFGEFYRNYMDNQGITVITSEPANQGGKTTITRMVALLIWGGDLTLTNNSRVTYSNVMNIYCPEKRDAFIEGEIQTEEGVFYLKRSFVKKTSKNGEESVKHTFEIYKYVSEATVETVVINGKHAINCAKKDAVQTKKIHQEAFGTYEEYVMASQFDSNNITKWLKQKPKERHESFCRDFGLKILQDKGEIAKQLYKDFRDTRKNTASLEYLQKEITGKIQQLTALEEKVVELNNINKDIDKLIDATTNSSMFSIKSVEEKIAINERAVKEAEKLENMYSTLKQREQDYCNYIAQYPHLFNRAVTNFDEIDVVKQDVEFYKERYEKLLTEINALRTELENSKNNLPKEIVTLQSIKDLLINSSKEVLVQKSQPPRFNEHTELDVITKKYNETLAEFSNINSQISELNVKIESLGQPFVCNRCNQTFNDRTEERNELKSKIQELELVKMAVHKFGTEIGDKKRSLETVIKNKVTEWINLQNEELAKYEAAIAETDVKIQHAYKAHTESLTKKLDALYLDKQNLTVGVEKLNTLWSEAAHYNQLMTAYIANWGSFTPNIFKEKLVELRQELIMYNNAVAKDKAEKNHNIQMINTAKAQILQLKSDIDEKNDLLSQETENHLQEIAYKMYLQIHSESGLPKIFLSELIPHLNAELHKLLNGMVDFEVTMTYENGEINFEMTRNGISIYLEAASGYEMTVAMLAIHYVKMRISTIPNPNILVLDELFSTVSTNNFVHIKRIIDKMLDIYPVIDIITHIPFLKNWADHLLYVEKQGNISTIVQK